MSETEEGSNHMSEKVMWLHLDSGGEFTAYAPRTMTTQEWQQVKVMRGAMAGEWFGVTDGKLELKR